MSQNRLVTVRNKGKYCQNVSLPLLRRVYLAFRTLLRVISRQSRAITQGIPYVNSEVDSLSLSWDIFVFNLENLCVVEGVSSVSSWIKNTTDFVGQKLAFLYAKGRKLYLLYCPNLGMIWCVKRGGYDVYFYVGYMQHMHVYYCFFKSNLECSCCVSFNNISS